MQTIGVGLLALALLSAPAAASDVGGAWRVNGEVGGTPFTLDCRFEPHGASLGGVCVEVGGDNAKVHAGLAHTLATGAIAGSQVRWSYPASFLIAKFTVSFTGAIEGDRMAGTVAAAGRKGGFTATRK